MVCERERQREREGERARESEIERDLEREIEREREGPISRKFRQGGQFVGLRSCTRFGSCTRSGHVGFPSNSIPLHVCHCGGWSIEASQCFLRHQ